jgi:hypothetical protein
VEPQQQENASVAEPGSGPEEIGVSQLTNVLKDGHRCSCL